MGIFKETLPDYLKKQIRIREKILQTGNNPTEGRSIAQLSTDDYDTKLPQGAFHTWTLNKSCTIRMASCVDLIDDDILEISKNNPAINRLAEKDLLGPGLSLAYILEGGTIIKGAKQARVKNDKGGYDKKLSINKKSLKRRGFPGLGRPLGGTYGDPIIRSDAKDGYGIVPMPGIVKMDVATKSAYGSLREAKVEFVCHNLRQLEILELLYMRPGYPVLLEWGWTPFIGNGGKIVPKFDYISEEPAFYDKGISQVGIQDKLFQNKKKYSGCYDGLLGLVKNFSFTLREDGGFNCTTELMGMGEMLGSLKGEFTTIQATDGTRKGIPVLQQFIDKSIDYIGMRGINFDDTIAAADEDKDYAAGGIQFEQRVNDEGELELDEGFWEDKDYELESEEYAPGYTLNPQTGTYYSTEGATARAKPSEVKKDYEASFMDKNAKGTFEGAQLISFKEGRSFWSKVLSNYYGLLGHKNIQDHKVEEAIKKAKIHASFIRLDSLCFILNKYCSQKIPKTQVQGFHGGSNFTSFQTVLYNPSKSGQAKLKPSLLNEYKNKAKKIITDFPEDILDMSVDPYICLLPNQYPRLKDDPAYAHPLGNHYGYFDKNGRSDKNFQNYYRGCIEAGSEVAYRSVGHILLNLDMLQQVHKDVYDAGKSDDYSLGTFMKNVLDKINTVVGNAHNLTLQTDNQYPNTAIIVDLSCEIDTSVKDIKDVFEFNVQSNKSAVRKFSYNSSVPSSMAATIAVGAAAADNLGSLDEVTFKSMNRGINNRLYTPPPPPSETSEKKPTQAQITAAKDARKRKVEELSTKVEDLTRYACSILTGTFFKKGSKNKKQVNIQKRNIERIHALTDDLLTLSKEKALPKYNPPTPTPIPIKIDLELDGISGMVMGQLFRVDESRLPVHYRKRDIHFIIMGEKQEITVGGDWTTIISGQMQLFPESLAKREVDQGKFSPDIQKWDDLIHKKWGLKDGEVKDYGNTTVSRVGDDIILKGPGPAQTYTNNADGSSKANANCFLSGTQISMVNKTTKNIEDIIIGDIVKAFDTDTNTIIDSLVVKTFIHPDNKEYYIINNNLKVTSEHPMWVNNDWKKVNNLQVGDKLLHLDGSNVEIESIEVKQETSTVYNFEVDNVHNYFANNYLAHNKNAI